MPSGEDPQRFLPHRPPMVLLDAIASIDSGVLRGWWRAPVDGPWIREGVLVRAALVEMAAQAVAARMGQERALRGLPPCPGVMGALRSVRFSGDTRPGEPLVVDVDVRTRYDRFLRVDFVVRCGDAPRCEGEMTLALLWDASEQQLS